MKRFFTTLLTLVLIFAVAAGIYMTRCYVSANEIPESMELVPLVTEPALSDPVEKTLNSNEETINETTVADNIEEKTIDEIEVVEEVIEQETPHEEEETEFISEEIIETECDHLWKYELISDDETGELLDTRCCLKCAEFHVVDTSSAQW